MGQSLNESINGSLTMLFYNITLHAQLKLTWFNINVKDTLYLFFCMILKQSCDKFAGHRLVPTDL